MTEKRKVGIFGGTFDPVHNGHLMIAEAARTELSLDEMIFIPAGRPPFKDGAAHLASESDRLSMVRLAIAGNPHFSVSDVEVRSDDVSYTYVTLETLSREMPDAELYFLMGEDSLFALETWMEPRRIAESAVIVCAGREGTYNEEGAEHEKRLIEQAEHLKDTLGAKVLLLHSPFIDLSSTSIRERIAAGFGARYEVPETVWHYILANGLYRQTDKHRSAEEKRSGAASGHYTILPAEPDDPGFSPGQTEELFDVSVQFPRIEHSVRKSLSDARMRHTEGVSYTAAALAMAWHENVSKAALAGLLHDCAKWMTEEELITYCVENGIHITEYEYQSPKLLHAKVGASIAKDKYGIVDNSMLSAIRYHTTGRPDMTLLEKIIYTADMIEPGRIRMTGLPVYRYLAFRDLDLCVYRIMADTLEYLKIRKKNIDKTTKEAYDFYQELIQRREI